MLAEDAGHPRFRSLIDFLARLPAIALTEGEHRGIGAGLEGGVWWVKFSLDLDHKLAWNVVQELASVLNYLSLSERLPTTFKPVSPPVYLNGGPRDYLSWLIECRLEDMPPGTVAKWLEERLPKPVDDLAQWASDED